MAGNRSPGAVLSWPIFGLVAATSVSLGASEPLHVRIDRYLEQTHVAAVSDAASDGEFLRRVYLDLAGRIPPADEARRFLDDTSANKRAAVIEHLLDSPQYVRHLTNVLDVMLMERRSGKHVKQDAWQKYLLESVAANKPWNELVAELLAADGSDEKVRAAGSFYLAREAEPNLLTRDVGRILFGMDLQCCQCHDHPLIDSYYQSDYYGIFAFLNRGFLFTDKDKQVFYAEKAEGDVTFTSVFTEEQGSTRPRLPGDVEIIEPVFGRGHEYLVKPADKVRPVPKYSRRAKLAELATDGSNRAFNRNIANRLWAHMMGRGLVHPADLHHLDNPPSHPQLLDLLADGFVELDFNIKEFLRQLALSAAYQRSLELPDGATLGKAAAVRLAELETVVGLRERECDTIHQQVLQAEQAFNEAKLSADSLDAEFNKANTAVAAAQKSRDETAKKLTAAQKDVAAQQEVALALETAASSAQRAAAKLPHDQPLMQAVETFQTRAKQIAAKVTAAEKTVAELMPAFREAEQKLDAAEAQAGQIQARLEQALGAVSELRTPLQAAIREFQASQVVAQTAQSEFELARSSVAHTRLLKSAEASTQAYEAARADLKSTRAQLDLALLELPQLESEFQARRTQHDAAARLCRESQDQLRLKKEIAALVSSAATSAAAASSKLPDDGEIKQAAKNVQRRSELLQGELAAAKQVHEQHQQAQAATEMDVSAAEQKLQTAQEAAGQLQQKVERLQTELPAIASRAEQDRAAAKRSMNEVSDLLSRHFYMASLTALTPEQMAWSVMQATGVIAQQQPAAQTEVDKKLPLDEQDTQNVERLAARARATEQFVYAKLKGNVGTFVKLFGHASGQPQSDFFATVDQALYFSNAGGLQSWLQPAAGNLTDRLHKLDDPRAVAEELYISVLTRRPSQEETADVLEYLQERRKARTDALQEMVWGLITSSEFRFSY